MLLEANKVPYENFMIKIAKGENLNFVAIKFNMCFLILLQVNPGLRNIKKWTLPKKSQLLMMEGFVYLKGISPPTLLYFCIIPYCIIPYCMIPYSVLPYCIIPQCGNYAIHSAEVPPLWPLVPIWHAATGKGQRVLGLASSEPSSGCSTNNVPKGTWVNFIENPSKNNDLLSIMKIIAFVLRGCSYCVLYNIECQCSIVAIHYWGKAPH